MINEIQLPTLLLRHPHPLPGTKPAWDHVTIELRPQVGCQSITAQAGFCGSLFTALQSPVPIVCGQTTKPDLESIKVVIRYLEPLSCERYGACVAHYGAGWLAIL